MAIWIETSEDVRREQRNVALLIIKKKLAEAKAEVDWLILATPTSERRNVITEINMHLMVAAGAAQTLNSEEK